MKKKKEKIEKLTVEADLEMVKEQKKHRGMTGWRFRKVVRVAGWLSIIGSLAFGIYKNFTAIDIKTVEKETIVRERLKNTSGAEEFVKDFAWVYFNVDPAHDAQEMRLERLERYLQRDIWEQVRKVKIESKERVRLSEIKVRNVTSLNEAETDLEVTIEMGLMQEDRWYGRTYVIGVHVDVDGSYVITKNPRITTLPGKSEYEAPRLENSQTLALSERDRIREFLETFFALYPKATEKELAYYVKDQTIRPLQMELEFVGLESVLIYDEDQIRVSLFVMYHDRDLDMLVSNQYELLLNTQEDGNYVIAEMR